MKTDNNYILAIAAWTILTIIILLHYFYDILPTRWVMGLTFADTLSIIGASDCFESGINPYVATDCDPWLRPFNYPKIWLDIFSFFSIKAEDLTTIILSLSYIFVLMNSLLFRIQKKREFIFFLFIILSPSVLLMIERGNCDVLIYILLLLSVYYIRKISFLPNDVRLHVSYILILITTILKFYPLFLLGLLLFENTGNRNRIIIFTYSVATIIVYFFLTYEDIVMINRNTPRSNFLAYGSKVVLQMVINGKTLLAVSWLFVLSILTYALYLNKKYSSYLGKILSGIGNRNYIILFIAGALVYIGTFTLGNNFDYRMVFLIMTLPLLFEVSKNLNFYQIIMIASIYIFVLYGSFLAEIAGYYFWYFVKIISTWIMLLMLSIVVAFFTVNRRIFLKSVN